jgi:hypothetical protein
MPTQDRSYLVQEYAVDAWQPMWCSDVHRRCKDVRLTFIGTATLSEIGHYFLPESIRRSLVEHSAPHRRSTLEDVVTNKSFRRDLFVKGGHQLLPHEAKEVIGSIRLQSFDLAPNCRYEFQTSFGLVQADSEAYQALEAAVDTLSPCISDLCLSLDRPLGEVLPMVSLLVHAGRLSVQRDDLSDDWRDINSLTTLKLVDLIAGGQPFSQVPVMASGMAINLSAVEAMICKGLSSGLSGDLLASLALSGLQEIGHVVLAPDGKPCSSDENALQLVRAISSNVVESRLPLFSRLGVL